MALTELTRNPLARIDLNARPGRAAVYFNRPAAEDLIKMLAASLEMTLPDASFCVMFIQHSDGVQVTVASDDAGSTH